MNVLFYSLETMPKAEIAGSPLWGMAVLLVGILTFGTMGEIVWTKWVGGPPMVVIEPLISGIPPEIRAETDIHLVAGLEGFWEVASSLDK